MIWQQVIKIAFPLSLTLGGWALTSATAPTQAQPLQIAQAQSAEAYGRAMRIGYAATAQRDYQTALINFRRALAARPGDRYAIAAIANVQSYIDQVRAIEARNRRVEELQDTLAEAVDEQDWVCAAATIDALVPLVPPDSIERGRLVAYRGELTGLLEARASLENWSTVCSANVATD